jgi:hypothetical protein
VADDAGPDEGRERLAEGVAAGGDAVSEVGEAERSITMERGDDGDGPAAVEELDGAFDSSPPRAIDV